MLSDCRIVVPGQISGQSAFQDLLRMIRSWIVRGSPQPLWIRRRRALKSGSSDHCEG